MDNTITALKNLYVALGGTAADVANKVTIPDMINAIATVAPSAELPAVTGSDNGNVLTVVGGVWAKAALPTPTAELPEVTGDDNGDVLTVVEGSWAKAEIPAELPAVTADDNGRILKVVDGVWALGDDNITDG